MKTILVLLMAIACAGCATRGTYRDQVMRWGPAWGGAEGGANPDNKCKKHSIEYHKVAALGDLPATDYVLGVVEFDDQGWFHHARQMQVLMEELRKEGEERDLIVSVFVHGWKHNAEYCDGNIACFRTLLASLARAETRYARGGKPRRVFGVYVGWRGLSVLGPDIIRSTSFWDRKATATQVALGSTRELLGRLRDFHETRNEPDEKAGRPTRNRLFITGHSFGGLIVYTSVAQYLINSAIVPDGPEEKKRYVKGFGDLVVLINPAFEAARYEPMHHIAQTRDYPPNQDPVFISITSKDDKATRTFFPLGRKVATILETYTSSPEKIEVTPRKDQVHTKEQERDANHGTMGHLPHYITHYLEPTTAGTLADLPGTSEAIDCQCPFEGYINLASSNPATEQRMYRDFIAKNMPGGYRERGWQRDFAGGLSLRHATKDPASMDPRDIESRPDNPYWVVQTDRPIIVEHNDFWTPYLLTFLRQVYDDILRDGPATEKAPPAARKTSPK